MIYKNKKFGVFGLGLSGIATMKYLTRKGAEFIAFDDNQKSISEISKKYPEFKDKICDLDNDLWQEIDYLILSPGIPLTLPFSHKVVKIAHKVNAKIICDIELLYLDNSDLYFIGITGTNGKSTTTALITHILKYNGIDAVAGGNIGIPVLDIDTSNKDKVLVVEASSYQLDLMDKTKFNIALFLNITPDHLDRHGNMENYKKSKYRIFKHQTNNDHAIINSNLDQLSNSISFSAKDLIKYNIPHNTSLLGEHNQENLAASIACCLKYGLSIEQIIAAIPSFVGLKHRMQYLGVNNGVTFINDSKATNADSTSKALSSFDNIIWIVGGVAKEGGIELLKEHFPKVKQALLIGRSSDEFSKTLEGKVKWKKCEDLENAFKEACKIAREGDVVLLSPACASFDQWKNFEKRGEAFIDMVALKV